MRLERTGNPALANHKVYFIQSNCSYCLCNSCGQRKTIRGRCRTLSLGRWTRRELSNSTGAKVPQRSRYSRDTKLTLPALVLPQPATVLPPHHFHIKTVRPHL